MNFFEAGVMIYSGFFFGTETQKPDAAGSVLKGLGAHEVRWTSVLRRPERSGDFPNKQGFCVTKALLAENLEFEFYGIPHSNAP